MAGAGAAAESVFGSAAVSVFSASGAFSASLGAAEASAGAASASPLSEEVQRVRLSRRSCMIRVLSRYDSSDRESSSAMASSNACLARWHARSGEFKIS